MISTGKTIPYILETPTPLPLDGVDLADLVYGCAFFQLRTDYTGAAIRIRRGSDNAELDISPTLEIAPGQIIVDPTAISDFGSDCFLVTMYDQVGTGVDWNEATTTLQLKICVAGVVNTNDKGIVGGLNAADFRRAISDNFTYPKDFVEMSGYSNGGVAITGRAGSRTLSNANGFFNMAYDNGANDILARIYSSASGSLVTFSKPDVLDPLNGVHSSLYCDDTNGAGFVRNQDSDTGTATWTANSRTAATSNKVYFGYIFATTANNTQHYSILFNNGDDNKSTYENRIMTLMGMI